MSAPKPETSPSASEPAGPFFSGRVVNWSVGSPTVKLKTGDTVAFTWMDVSLKFTLNSFTQELGTRDPKHPGTLTVRVGKDWAAAITVEIVKNESTYRPFDPKKGMPPLGYTDNDWFRRPQLQVRADHHGEFKSGSDNWDNLWTSYGGTGLRDALKPAAQDQRPKTIAVKEYFDLKPEREEDSQTVELYTNPRLQLVLWSPNLRGLPGVDEIHASEVIAAEWSIQR
ncbi:hypothetical protein Srot_0906 [Segniliparus rotundus DSM 44985]|uniref:Uncharacterized protein n=1 Tax=Segniliparus rotundus (strain ATCC BAA-972 / CDC 1076 / CIP 108378 / DSM 44985 / JCM 13578) TaxID=640132 RepID=D6ZEA3_SEGRD|nr:hypothetical protein [Segniliparus rotundus]ADG97383.1 hypothetical protein Srot_0906 [Segniliparus rotundus DSM 44985]